MKRCPCCGETKALEDFNRNADGRLRGWCKRCGARQSAAWQRANPERFKALQQANSRRRTAASVAARAKWAAIAAEAAASA